MIVNLSLSLNSYTPILTPIIPLLIQLLKRLSQKNLIPLTQILHISLKKYLRPGQRIKSIPIILYLQITHPQISQSQHIIRFIFNGHLITSNSFIIILLIHINITQIIIRISIPRIYLKRTTMQPLRLLNISLLLIYIGHIIICHMEIRINFYTLIKKFNRFIILLHFKISISYRIIQTINLSF